MRDRRTLAIILVLVFVVVPVIVFILYLLFWQPKSPEVVLTQYTDKDTGEVIDSYSNIYPEKYGNSSINILGLVKLNQDTYSREQFLFIKDSIVQYGTENLKGKYSLLVVLPEPYVNNGGNITTRLRLGEGDESVPITVTALSSGETRVVITDPENKYGGSYDSGVFTVLAD